MTLSQAYLEWKQETEQRGIQQGVQQGIQQGAQQERQTTIENFLKARFGTLDDRLVAIIPPFAALPPQEYAALLMQLTQLSREALLEKFRDNLP